MHHPLLASDANDNDSNVSLDRLLVPSSHFGLSAESTPIEIAKQTMDHPRFGSKRGKILNLCRRRDAVAYQRLW
jgi:hypothetical protein